jgi:GT2 family glycosyltransferase/glycosyltransferase involved in cell wall biosynthesis
MSIPEFLRRTLGRVTAQFSRSARRRAAARHVKEQASLDEILASGMFDRDYYLAHSPDVVAAGMDPALHYLRHGWREGRQPSLAFNGDFYIGVHADVRAEGFHPLLHYARHGKTEGRAVRANAAPAPQPRAPREDEWQALFAALEAQAPQPPVLDVVVPVYRGYAETAHCLYTLAWTRLEPGPPFEIVAIDDASPEAGLRGLLQQLAARGVLTLLRNESNAGFVRSVNRGMALHPSRDVILLNADTEVHGDWVARLARAAASRPDIGTATPFSNNATFCSYPVIGKVFAGAFETGFDEIDRLAARANAGRTFDLPAARGFCMYLRRACLQAAGEFDAAAFGRGHGEETDFSRRALARGWRSVLAADVFVRHLGNVSFGDTAPAQGRRALDVLRRRHPGYLEEEAHFVARDPLMEPRRRLTAARFGHASARCILFVVHHAEGGTRRHVEELAGLLASQGIGALFLRPAADGTPALELAHAAIPEATGTLRLEPSADFDYAAQLLRDLDVFHIHVHHLMHFPAGTAELVGALARAAGIAYDFTAHDYFSICPRVTMLGAGDVYCGNVDAAVCQRCVDALGTPFGTVQVAAWRAQYEPLLRAARRVLVPDEDVAVRLRSALPGLEAIVRPHPEPIPPLRAAPRPRAAGEPLRVAVIGAIGAHKGVGRVLRYAEHAAREGLPLRYVIVAGSPTLAAPGLPTIEPFFIGRCSEARLAQLVAQCDSHLALFASAGPETYSYTLSQAFFAALYPVAFDVGAIARRIRAAAWGRVLPLAWIDDAARVNAALLECAVTSLPPDWPPVPGAAAYPDLERDYYGLTPS